MGSVIPLKKSANSAYLELKNLLGNKLEKVESLIELKLKSEVNLIEKMNAEQVRKLINDGTIKDGMIPKVETCLNAVEKGVDAAVIIDGRVPHALLLELFTEHGAGTLIEAN